MKALRSDPGLPFHYEKKNGKLDDEFSAFLGRTGPPPTPRNQGNPHSDDSKSKSDQNDGVDFSVPEEEQEAEGKETLQLPNPNLARNYHIT